MLARLVPLTAAALLIAAPASAHFVFVVPSADGRCAQVVFSEDLSADSNVPIKNVAGLKLRLLSAGAESELEPTLGEHTLELNLPEASGPRTIAGSVAYGVMKRGEGKPFLLMYHPRALLGDPFAEAAAAADKPAVPVQISLLGKPGQTQFVVTAGGKPVAGAEVHVLLPDGSKKKVATDAEGRTPALEATGRFGVWARYVEATAGELGEKKYEEIRHYPSLVVDVPTSK